MAARQLLVAGRVQRVGFRDWVIRTAKVWGISGWIRNCADGRVEILAVADDSTIDAFVDHCREGPPTAEIIHIDAWPTEVQRLQARGFTKRLAA